MCKNIHGVNVGDIFYSSWGYDQTNIDFFEVVKVTEKMVTVRPIKSEQTEKGFMHGTTVPVRGAFMRDDAFYKDFYRTRTEKSYFGDEPILKNVDARNHLGHLHTGKPQHYSEWR